MVSDDIGENSAAHEKFSGNPHEAGAQFADQIVENAVGYGFVKATLVAERPHVELEAFQFDAFGFRNVVQNDRREVRLAGHRTQAGEFGNLHMNMEIALWGRVGKGN